MRVSLSVCGEVGFLALAIGLGRTAPVRIEDGRGARVRVQSGLVWLTQQGCIDDMILKAGASYLIERGGLTLVSNFGNQPAVITIEPPTWVK